MGNATPTTCGHTPHEAKGLCKKCYMAVYWAARRVKRGSREETPTICGHAPHEAKGLCKKCYMFAWREANRASMREADRQYHLANAERHRASNRAWRYANKARVQADNRQWRAANRDRQNAYSRKRYALLNGADADLTVDQWLVVLVEFDGHCAYCDRTDLPLVMEHMTPLSRGGAHTISNVVPACPSCNGSKHTKTAFEFAGWKIPPRRQCA